MSVVDKLDAARRSLSGSNTAVAVCKATSREVMGPKRKHVEYLVECTKNQQFDLGNLADLVFERCRMASWVIVSKALLTFHNLMSNGDERFLENLVSKSSMFTLESFQDKTVTGYDMSSFVRRYSSYLKLKTTLYGEVEFDFCRAKRGADGVLRTLDTPTLIKTLGEIQRLLDVLLEVDVQSSEFTNGIINSAFVLLFKDNIKLFACYNDGMIKLLEIYSTLNKFDCREGLELYKKFLLRTETVQKFLKVAQDIGVSENAIPDLVEAPSGLLESLQQHYNYLEKGQTPASTTHANLAPVNIPATSEQFNFKEEEPDTPSEVTQDSGQQQTLLRTVQSDQASAGLQDDSWKTIFEPDEDPKPTSTSSSSDDLLQLHSVFQVQQTQQAPAGYFPPQSDFGQTANPQAGYQPAAAVNGFGQTQSWGQNAPNTGGNSKSTNPFDTSHEFSSRDVMQPMNKVQPQETAKTSPGDLHSTLNKVVNSLDDFNLSKTTTTLNLTSGGGAGGGHQWSAPKPKVKTGGQNFQLGTTAGATMSAQNPTPPPVVSSIPPQIGGMGPRPAAMGPRPAMGPGYVQPGMYGGTQPTLYGPRPPMMARPQGNMYPQPIVRPNNPFGNPAPRNQALF